MHDVAGPTKAEMANTIAATLDRHLTSLAEADQTPPSLKGIVPKLSAVTAAVAGALATKAAKGRGQVLLFIASTHACNAAVVSAVVALKNLTEPGAQWNPKESAPGIDPVDDPDLQRNLGQRFASEAALKLVEAGWTVEQVLGGWIVVTGIAAWDGDELQAIQTETFFPDTFETLPC